MLMKHHNQRQQVFELSKVEANKDLFGLCVTGTYSLVKVDLVVLFLFLFFAVILKVEWGGFIKIVYFMYFFPLNWSLTKKLILGYFFLLFPCYHLIPQTKILIKSQKF